MARYKNKTTGNIDTYMNNTGGRLTVKAGFLRPQEQFDAIDRGSVLEIISGEDTGRFVYERDCVLVVTSPPPPPSIRARIVLNEPDGRIRIFEEVL